MSRTSTETLPAAHARMPAFLSPSGTPDATRLRRLRVAVIGAGAVGRNVALHLARLMIAELWIVDPGRFKPESLLTQAILPRDIGQPKAANAAGLCRKISPRTRVRAFDAAFEDLEALDLVDADVVVLGTDNLLAEVQVGQRCLHLQRPLVQASIHGDTLCAQVRFFGNALAAGPCPACGFTTEEWAHLHRSTSFSCDGSSGVRAETRVETQPTTSVSFLCALAADLAMTQILRHTLGLGAPVADTVIEHSGYTHRTVTSPLRRNRDCPAEHVPWKLAVARGSLADSTLRELAREAGFTDANRLRRTAFSIGALSYVERGICEGGHVAPVGRFVGTGGSAQTCPRCAAPVWPHPFHTHARASGRLLTPLLDRPLGEIADGTPRWVVVREAEEAFLFRARHAHEKEAERCN